MIPSARQTYNRKFTPARYAALLDDIRAATGVNPDFRIAETPVFVPQDLGARLREAGDAILSHIRQPGFAELTDAAIPPQFAVPGPEGRPHFIIIDFAVCRGEKGELIPQLIELQGFPSLFGFQELLAGAYRQSMEAVPEAYQSYGSGLDHEGYVRLLQRTILAGHAPAEVVLLEVLPQQQKTLIDFVRTEQLLGIPTVCLSEVRREGKTLYYEKDGRKQVIRRIYNRVIAEDADAQRAALGDVVDLREGFDVEWATHPNWYYRISKYLLPHLQGPYAPKAWFLHEIPVLPKDLENYVLKPLFSFAGQGVLIDPTLADVEAITDPENWILQQKVAYAPVIETPTGPAKCEIRLMYCWPDDAPAPVLAQNLARLSKGKMIGVSYNRDLDWVGGSSAFFE
ncbi:hypothetical protein ACWKWU_02415 [Chitinophaga lutea]